MRAFPLLLIPLSLATAGCSDLGETPLQPQGTAAASSTANATRNTAPSTPQLLVSGLQGGGGSAVGPGGALFVTEGAIGWVSRVDPQTGAVTTFASGLPPSVIGVGGAVDVAFIGGTAFALVTLVSSDVGGDDVVGIYRVDGPDSFTVIADLGAYNLANPSKGPFFVPTGFQYSLQPYRGGLLVSDGHHNRVLHVTLGGDVTELIAFGNVVPTGLEVSGETIYLSQAGPVPHEPENGRVVSFGPESAAATEIAAGARLLVDVEFGRGRTLFALSQGVWDGVAEGSPAEPNTGSLVQVDGEGGFTVIAEDLDRPTSLELIGNTAYIVTLTGQVWTVQNVARPPFGEPR